MATPAPLEPAKEKEFVFGRQPKAPAIVSPPPATAPISMRLRADFVAALKRASLERQLEGVEPRTMRAILEEAVEPWLRSNGYLP